MAQEHNPRERRERKLSFFRMEAHAAEAVDCLVMQRQSLGAVARPGMYYYDRRSAQEERRSRGRVGDPFQVAVPTTDSAFPLFSFGSCQVQSTRGRRMQRLVAEIKETAELRLLRSAAVHEQEGQGGRARAAKLFLLSRPVQVLQFHL